MIGRIDRRAGCGQTIPADDVQPKPDQNERSDDQCEEQYFKSSIHRSIAEEAGVVKEQRCGVEQAVHSVEDTAMSGNELAGVFDSQIAFDR